MASRRRQVIGAPAPATASSSPAPATGQPLGYSYGHGHGHGHVHLHPHHEAVETLTVDDYSTLLPWSGGYPAGGWGLGWLLWGLILLMAFLAALVGFLLLVQNRLRLNELESVQRFCLEADGAQVLGSVGDAAPARALGTLTLDRALGKVSWSLLYADAGEKPTGLALHGPLDDASPETAAIVLTLDVDSALPPGPTGELKGSKNSVAVSKIDDILDDPVRYYLQTTDTTFTAGAVRAALRSRC